MKTLYLHGLNSYPLPEKLDMLEKAGLNVVALHLDYANEKNVYQTLKNYALEEEVEFLVGSSLGGFIAFWLAEDLGLPCLLFNPAMTYGECLDSYEPEVSSRLCPARFVVIGAYDETIDPEESLRFFREQDEGECYQRVITCDWLEHQIDFATFEEMVCWAMKSYTIFKESNRD